MRDTTSQIMQDKRRVPRTTPTQTTLLCSINQPDEPDSPPTGRKNLFRVFHPSNPATRSETVETLDTPTCERGFGKQDVLADRRLVCTLIRKSPLTPARFMKQCPKFTTDSIKIPLPPSQLTHLKREDFIVSG